MAEPSVASRSNTPIDKDAKDTNDTNDTNNGIIRNMSPPSLVGLVIVGSPPRNRNRDSGFILDEFFERQGEQWAASIEREDTVYPDIFMPIPINPIHLSPVQLRELLTGPTISILFRPSAHEFAYLLCANFPKKVAIVFCQQWRDQLPPIPNNDRAMSQMSLRDMEWNMPERVIVTGGCPETYLKMLEWMYGCCLRGLIGDPIIGYGIGSFFQNYLIHCNAIIIGCDYLAQMSDRRMFVIGQGQIHSDDIECIWYYAPQDIPMKRFLVRHIAWRILQGTLRGMGHYWGLRRRLPEFDQAINDQIHAWRENREREARAQMEEQVAGMPARETQVPRRVQSQPLLSRPDLVGSNDHQEEEMARDGNTEEDQDQDQTQDNNTVHAPVARRPAGGGNTWVRLDLADLGVTRQSYSGSV